MGKPIELESVPFAIIDTETTGFSPWLKDRVIEIAVVRFDLSDGIRDEFCTLVNPRRDVGRTDIHGIRASDLKDAPQWEDISGDIASRIQDAVIAAHNLTFELGFVTAEFARVGVNVPSPYPGLCTLGLSRRFLPEIGSHKLKHCCGYAGIELEGEHSALGDARATAHLLACLLVVAKSHGVTSLTKLGSKSTELPNVWCAAPRSGRAMPRRRSTETQVLPYLARLVANLPPTPFDDTEEGAYLDILDRAVADRYVSAEEAKALERVAFDTGLTRARVFETHHKYLRSLVRAAAADSVITEAERQDLESVCDLLGIDRSALDSALRDVHAEAEGALSIALARSIVASPSPSATPSSSKPVRLTRKDLEGRSVCFTGTFLGKVGGRSVTRAVVEEMATEAGLVVRHSVHEDLDFLVAADVESLSSKAKLARALGVRIVEEAEFWGALEVTVVMNG
jgi:DNA polymerase-3 subunit epsilon